MINLTIIIVAGFVIVVNDVFPYHFNVKKFLRIMVSCYYFHFLWKIIFIVRQLSNYEKNYEDID